MSILYNLWPLIFPKNGRQAKYEKLPIKKANDGKWYFEIQYITPSKALAGRKIKISNSNRYNSIGYETFDLCEKGK